MAVEYGFFDSVDGDRKYSADDLSNFWLNLVTNGVLASPAGNLKVVPLGTSGMAVRVNPGWGYINCKYVHVTSQEYISLEKAHESLPRYDRIFLRLGSPERKMTIEARSGTPAENPQPPAPTRANGYYDLSLARILVLPGVTGISESNITDERGDPSVCGYITWNGGLPDTSELAKQLGGISFVRLTRGEYDSIAAKDKDTVYFVAEDDGSITAYLSGAELGGGETAKNVSLSVSAVKGFSAEMTKED